MATRVDALNVTMICPNLACSKTVVAPGAARGNTVRCPHCNTAFRVPGDDRSSSGGVKAAARTR